MYYVYVLESQRDDNFYIGYTADLETRIKEHEQGRVSATKYRRPIKLIYYESYITKKDAKNREQFLKSGSGHQYLEKQLSVYLSDD